MKFFDFLEKGGINHYCKKPRKKPEKLKNEVLNISLQKLITDEPDIAQKCSGPAAVNTNWQEFKIY